MVESGEGTRVPQTVGRKEYSPQGTPFGSEVKRGNLVLKRENLHRMKEKPIKWAKICIRKQNLPPSRFGDFFF